MTDSIRINKYIALHGGLSRREADEYLAKKRVTLNGVVASLGAQVGAGDSVAIDGTMLGTAQFEYVALNKPVGYVCSRKRQGDAPTIYELLPENLRTLKPVGRLDMNSSGIILLTNDGDFAHQMTHPSFHKTKVYEVQLDQPLQPLHQQMISDFGVMLDDGKSQFVVSRLDGKTASYQITMSEGRNRQIRRTFAALGYTVTALHRTQFGPYQLRDLAPGTYEVVAR